MGYYNCFTPHVILRNLLENLDMEVPDELKTLDNSSTDPQKFS